MDRSQKGLPDLHYWDATRDALHGASQVLGQVRSSTVEALPNSLHFGLNPTSEGVSTGPLPWGGELRLDFARAEVRYLWGDQNELRLAIRGHSLKELSSKLESRLAELGHSSMPIPVKSPPAGLLLPDPSTAEDYRDALQKIRQGLALFRGHLGGYLTPIVLWPHHFDLAFLWFPAQGRDEHQDPHMAFGFAPLSHGFPRPYLYAYAWPVPEAVTEIELPGPARWYAEGWTGAVLDYDALATVDDPVGVMESVFLATWSRVAPRLSDL